jgi:hypothetical protein
MENFIKSIKDDIINSNSCILKDGDFIDIIYYQDIKFTNLDGIFIRDEYIDTYNNLVDEYIKGNVDIYNLKINGKEFCKEQKIIIFLMILTIYVYKKKKEKISF